MKYHKQIRKRGIGQEDQMQIQFGQLIARYEALDKLNAVWWTYIPLGEYRLHSTAAMLKKKGVKAGMADYLFMVGKDDWLYFIWIEFKTDKGKQNPNQERFQGLISKYQNSAYLIVKSVAEAIRILEKHQILLTK